MIVPFHVPFLDDRETQAAVSVIREGALGGGGRYTRQVEASLQSLTGAPYAFFVTSCTHAMELALMALGVGPGDDVILPSFTFTSTATCIVRQGAQPVFADIDPRTWNLDPDDVARCLSPRTRAIMPVHYAGHPAPLKEIAELIAPPTVIVEDAAHAFTATYLGSPAGTIGAAGCFSFHVSKNVTCGEGGGLVVKDPAVAQRAEFIREKGTNRSKYFRGEVNKYTWVDIGSSYLPSDLLAAILYAQLERLSAIQRRRKFLYRRYEQNLSMLAQGGKLRLPTIPPDCQSNYHIFYILLSTEKVRNNLMNILKSQGILAVFHYIPLHLSPMGIKLGYQKGDLRRTEEFSGRLLRLPLYPDLTTKQQDLVIRSIQRFFRQ